MPFNAPPRTLPLLAYLLLHRAQPCERQQIAYALWPDEAEETARANLRRHLHQLLRALPPAPSAQPWLIQEHSLLSWNAQADYWLDVAEFESLVSHPTRFTEALSCYSGDLLENCYDDWVFFERERLRNLHLDLLSRLALEQRAVRNFPQAIRFTQRLLLQDPFHEDALRLLVSLRYESGDRAGALQDYEQFERRLRAEMGVAPMPETRALLELVRRNAPLPGNALPHDSAQPGDDRARMASLSLLPFVGREPELQSASARWSRAVRSRGGFLLIGGEAGVGKSRLAREIALHVESQGGRVLFGGASPSQTRPYQPLIEALDASLPLLEGLDLSPARLAALVPLLPRLALSKPIPALPTLEPDRERIRLFDAIAACLEQLSGPRPLLVILEDLHWAGQATLDLVEFLTRRAAGKPILLLGTYRDEETPRSHPLRKLRRTLQAEALADHIALGRLSASAVHALLQQLPSALLPAQEGLTERLFAESEGHPLLIDQLLDHWRQPGQSALAGIPGGIRAAILARLSRLSEASRAYAEVAAVLGPAFDAEAVREVGGWDEAQAHQALSDLLDSRLARDTEGRSRFDYLFTHHLIQSTLYDEIPLPKRRRRHLRAAEVLPDLFPEHRQEMLGDLARHYDLGGSLTQAIPLYLQHAQRQVSLFADTEALVSIQRALELLDAQPSSHPSRLAIDLLLLRQAIQRRKGQPEQQWQDLLRLRQLLACLHDAELEFQVIQLQIEHKRDQRDLASAFQLLEELKDCASRLNMPYWRTLCLQVEGQVQIAANSPERAQSLLQRALATWEQLGDRTNQLYCLCYLADIIQTQRKSREVEDLLPKALALCSEQTPPAQLMRTLLSAANSGIINGNPPRTLHYASQLAALAERVGDLGWQATALRLLGLANTHLFNIDLARKQLEKAAQIFLSIQRLKPYAQTLESLGSLEVSIGQYEQSRRYHQQSLEIHQRLQQLDGVCIGLVNLAYVCSLQEDFQLEKEYGQKGLEAALALGNRYLEAVALQNIGDAELGMQQLSSALQRFHLSRGILEELGQTRELTGILSDIAITQMKMGELDSALANVDEVLSNYKKIQGSDENLHRHLWTAARVYHAAGRKEQAAQCAGRAYHEYLQMLQNFPDADSRQAFSQIRHNRQILAYHEQDLWP